MAGAAIAGAADFGDPVDGTAHAAAATAATTAVASVQATVRALGTVVLGATSQQGDSDAVHLHEHVACTAVADAAEGLRVGEEELPIEAHTRAELLTEVAGVCCRLLIEEADDDHSFVSWTLPNGSFITLEGDTRGICVLAQDVGGSVELDAGTEAVLLHVGWPEGTFHGATLTATTEWYVEEDAIVVGEIARLIVGTLIDVFGGDPAEVTRALSLASADTL